MISFKYLLSGRHVSAKICHTWTLRCASNLHYEKLALASLTVGDRWNGIVRLRTKTTEFFFLLNVQPQPMMLNRSLSTQ
jgi:hypothetical protein